MAGGAVESGRSVASKVAAMLMVFRGGSTYSLTELARLAGLPVSTAHRLAGELASRRILERTEDGGYRIGLALRMIGPGQWSSPPLLECAHAVMDDLVGVTEATVRLGVLRDLRVAYAETRPGAEPPTCFGGCVLPAHVTALGRALLAFSPSAVGDALVAAGSSADRLRRSLGVTRLTRVAVSRREPEAGGSAVAMPVFGAGGTVVAALEVGVHDLRTDLESARAVLTVATGSLSRELATTGEHRAAAG